MPTLRAPRALAALTALILALTIAPVSGAWAAPTVLGTCVIVENPTIDDHTECPGADLSFSVGWVSGLNLDYANFAGADLTDSPLIIESASHKHMNLDGATLDGVPLVGLDLTTSSMAGASMIGTVMVGADLSGLDLSGNDLTGAIGVDGDFTGADLSGATMTGSTFINAVMAGANLAGADLTDAAVLEADFAGANLAGVTFGGTANTMDANFTGANLTDTLWAATANPTGGGVFDGATLTHTQLPAGLGGSSWRGTDATTATFAADTDLGGSDWTDANLSGQHFNGVRFGGSDLLRANLAGITVETGSQFEAGGVNFTEANLSGVDLRPAGHVHLGGAVFAHTNLANSYLPLAGGGYFGDANLESATLWGNGGGTVFHRSNLTGATFLHGADASAPLDLGGVEFVEVDATGANFDHTILGGTAFIRTNLTGARIQSLEVYGLGGVLFLDSDLTNAQLPPAKNLYGWDAQKWLYGIFIENTTLTGTSLDVDDVAVLAPTPAPHTVSWDAPPAFANSDGQVPWGPAYDGGYWWGTRYSCDRTPGDTFALGITTVTCELTIDHSTGIEPWQQPDRFDLDNARPGTSNPGESGIGIYVGLGEQSFTGVPAGTTLAELEDFINTDSATRHGPVFFPTEAGIYTSSTTSFTVTVNAAPTLTGTADAGTVGEPFSAQLSALGFPTPTLAITDGTLPDGVTLAASGLIAGTPRPGSGGTYSVTVAASNNSGQASLLLEFAIDEPLPASSGGGSNSLADTGVDTGNAGLLGIALLLPGILLLAAAQAVRVSRRQRSTRNTR